jgi:hypothetical protein
VLDLLADDLVLAVDAVPGPLRAARTQLGPVAVGEPLVMTDFDYAQSATCQRTSDGRRFSCGGSHGP